MNTYLSMAIVGLMAILLFTLTDPFMYWMPGATQVVALTLAAVAVAAWAGIVLRESRGDERELQLRAFAGRGAYLSGVALLTLALLIQGLQHAIDPWIPLTLGSMVAAKLAARLYADRTH